MTAEEPAETTAENFFVSTEGAEVWTRGQEERAKYLGPSTELMLDLAGLKPGSRVLDVAAGSGEQSLLALQRVGPTGSVLATDISASMLEQAQLAARGVGRENLQIRVMDANDLNLPAESFEAAISRLGLMFVPDLQRTLTQILRVLVPGGRLAAIVWGPMERNQMQKASGEVASRYAGARVVAERLAPIFSLSDPQRLEEALRSVGYRDVCTRTVDASRQFASAREAAATAMQSSPTLTAAIKNLPPTEQAAAARDLENEIRQFEGPDGCICPGEVILAVGTK
jgi:ubiquinone/menaquinone biosynthesis C-methylase UbiE